MATHGEQEKRHYPRGKHPNCLKNLAPPWQPGHSGNPEGISLLREVNLLLAKPLEKPGPKAPGKMHLAYAIIMDAIRKGNLSDRKEIWQRLDGVLTQEISGPGGTPLIDNRSVIIGLLNEPDTRSALQSLGRVLALRASKPSDPV